jgi:hypothetical protein
MTTASSRLRYLRRRYDTSDALRDHVEAAYDCVERGLPRVFGYLLLPRERCSAGTVRLPAALALQLAAYELDRREKQA